MNKYTERADHLLSNYTFTRLNAKDKQLILEQMTETEYIMYRKIISNSQSSANYPDLPPHIKTNLSKNFHQLKQSQLSDFEKKLFVAAVLLILGSLLGYMSHAYFDNNKVPKNEEVMTNVTYADTIYIHRIDTIIQKIKSEPEIIVKDIYLETKDEVESPTVILPIENSSIANTFIVDELQEIEQKNFFNSLEITDLTNNKVGITIGEELELMELLEVMPSDGLE